MGLHADEENKAQEAGRSLARGHKDRTGDPIVPDALTSGTQRRQNPGPCSGLWLPTCDVVTFGWTPHAEGAWWPGAAATPVPSVLPVSQLMHCETWDETVLQPHDGRSDLTTWWNSDRPAHGAPCQGQEGGNARPRGECQLSRIRWMTWPRTCTNSTVTPRSTHTYAGCTDTRNPFSYSLSNSVNSCT